MSPGMACSCCSVNIPFRTTLLPPLCKNISKSRRLLNRRRQEFLLLPEPQVNTEPYLPVRPRKGGSTDVTRQGLPNLHNFLIYDHTVLPCTMRLGTSWSLASPGHCSSPGASNMDSASDGVWGLFFSTCNHAVLRNSTPSEHGETDLGQKHLKCEAKFEFPAPI